jgi:transposase-like protein
LKWRGLSGVRVMVSDDHEDLKSAIARRFQGASHQRWAYSLPNIRSDTLYTRLE